MSFGFYIYKSILYFLCQNTLQLAQFLARFGSQGGINGFCTQQFKRIIDCELIGYSFWQYQPANNLSAANTT